MDKNKLSRDYEKFPLKRGEKPPKEDLEYLYIECNWSQKDLSTHLSISISTLKRMLKDQNILKPKESICLRRKQTNLTKYGVAHTLGSLKVREKIKQTNLEKYGVESPLQNKKIREKIKQTNLEKYNAEFPTQSKKIQEKIKQTCLQKYGCSCSLSNSQTREKIKQTCIKKYGVENPSQSAEIKQKLGKISSSPEILQKIYETKKRNHSFNVSTPENLIYERLSEKFGKVLRQYKSEKYPFACDFYIPEIDLYVEFQGIWTHGKEPYNPENPKHQEILENWQEKAKTSEFYQNAIDIWTEVDPKKREVAKHSNLNWIEFFTIEEFEEWLVVI